MEFYLPSLLDNRQRCQDVIKHSLFPLSHETKSILLQRKWENKISDETKRNENKIQKVSFVNLEDSDDEEEILKLKSQSSMLPSANFSTDVSVFSKRHKSSDNANSDSDDEELISMLKSKVITGGFSQPSVDSYQTILKAGPPCHEPLFVRPVSSGDNCDQSVYALNSLFGGFVTNAEHAARFANGTALTPGSLCSLARANGIYLIPIRDIHENGIIDFFSHSFVWLQRFLLYTGKSYLFFYFHDTGGGNMDNHWHIIDLSLKTGGETIMFQHHVQLFQMHYMTKDSILLIGCTPSGECLQMMKSICKVETTSTTFAPTKRSFAHWFFSQPDTTGRHVSDALMWASAMSETYHGAESGSIPSSEFKSILRSPKCCLRFISERLYYHPISDNENVEIGKTFRLWSITEKTTGVNYVDDFMREVIINALAIYKSKIDASLLHQCSQDLSKAVLTVINLAKKPLDLISIYSYVVELTRHDKVFYPLLGTIALWRLNPSYAQCICDCINTVLVDWFVNRTLSRKRIIDFLEKSKTSAMNAIENCNYILPFSVSDFLSLVKREREVIEMVYTSLFNDDFVSRLQKKEDTLETIISFQHIELKDPKCFCVL